MSATSRVLLVEGSSDKSFFEALLRHLVLPVAVKVAPPREMGGQHNSKQGVYNLLPRLLPQLGQGQLLALALVLDADQPTHGGGVMATVQQVNTRLAPHGYAPLALHGASLNQGYVAEHADGLRAVGLWVMPNNADPGTLEDWLSRCRHPSEEPLWQHAQQAINTLPDGPRFNPATRRTKADVATWLAWQASPGEERYSLVNSLSTSRPLLNETAPLFQDLCRWLRHVFQPNEPENP